jgi:hypothetical protein
VDTHGADFHRPQLEKLDEFIKAMQMNEMHGRLAPSESRG